MPHWTELLFEENPELFLGLLEKRVERAEEEVDLLLSYIKDLGFSPRYVLDLNCGIGRHAIELGKRGVRVVGTDLSKLYLDLARNRAREEQLEGNVQFKMADMRNISSTFSADQLFDGIINLYTSFGYYDEKTNKEILRQCRKIVRSKGLFALEILNRDWVLMNLSQRSYSRYDGLVILENRTFDLETSRLQTTWTCLVQRDETDFELKEEVTLDQRVWSPHELINLFKDTGWKCKGICPGFGEWRDCVSLKEAKRVFLLAEKD